MPRRKTPTSGPLEELRAKARELQSQRVSEPVWIDSDTYERLVQFIGDERCSLDEALRRAVRIGVQVLLAERLASPTVSPYPAVEAARYSSPFSTEPDQVRNAGTYEAYEPPQTNFPDGTTNFAAVPPPGMF